jgi:hypothetical protein
MENVSVVEKVSTGFVVDWHLTHAIMTAGLLICIRTRNLRNMKEYIQLVDRYGDRVRGHLAK